MHNHGHGFWHCYWEEMCQTRLYYNYWGNVFIIITIVINIIILLESFCFVFKAVYIYKTK